MTNPRTRGRQERPGWQDQIPAGVPALPTAPNASSSQAMPKAAVSLRAALARTPEAPPPWYHCVVVSWRRVHYPASEPTRRRAFDSLEDAVAYRAKLERPEKDEGQGAALVRIDVMHALNARGDERPRWVEFADDYQRPEAWQPRSST
jgi:hypothetical protein